MSVEDFEYFLGRLFQKEFVLWDRKSFSETVNSTEDGLIMTDELKRIENRLNDVKSRIEHVVKRRNGTAAAKWHAHTTFTHTFKELPKRILEQLYSQSNSNEPSSSAFTLWDSLYTQAYCKFMELLIAHPELLDLSSNEADNFRTLHLCEAPGAFICALRDLMRGKLNDDVSKRWRWWMNSLFVESNGLKGLCLDENLLANNPDCMAFGPTGTGDIFDWNDEFMDAFIEKCGGRFSLVTADGSFDCSANPVAQETSVRPLIAQEVRIALKCLRLGGNFVLKAFTFFAKETMIDVLLPLFANFERVVCRKPTSSKPGNSEVYLVCLNRLENVISFDSENLPQTIIKKIMDCADFFAQHQIDFMELNLKTFCHWSQSQRAAVKIRKCAIVEYMVGEIVKRIIPLPPLNQN